ncbi:MAG: acetyltransferase [Candidatus Gottesmanbacteria bacterium GW2011_GWA2_43_14]|uniref:Acetyltransferase n=1 Tax=Candidatus Gottesmanbacteria bacterium GW2011_GWA2_43_14 TaxID=1618443 RepID=A0A0G1DKP2_9BACT|nr:MAG: acetyltransferase [Candidatus Gottesmanbacteria bacterium GW2011_GWA2_43_14]
MTGRKKIYLVGVRTGFISEVIELAELVGFKQIIPVDNQKGQKIKEIDGYLVVTIGELENDRAIKYFSCCIHTPSFRQSIIDSLPPKFFHPVSLVHPGAILSRRAVVSTKGAIIAAGCVIGAHSNIGDFTLINRGALIGHDVAIEELATVESGAILAGFSVIKKGAYVAMGAKILPKIIIGENSVVAAGSVVKEDVPANTLVAGVPAVIKKTNIPGYHGSG